MSATNNLLDKYAKACSVSQDKELAAKLRVTKSAVSNWRHGRAQPDAESVERMCEATGEPTARWLPLIESERARTPGARRAWLRLAQAAATVALTVLAWRHGSDGHALAFVAAVPLDIMRNSLSVGSTTTTMSLSP